MTAEANTTRTGACLCGAVTFTCELKSRHADVCHCGMCQTWSGPMFMVMMAGPADLASESRGHVSVFQSSEWGQRHFCRVCGTHLFAQAPAFGYFGVAVGTLESLDGFDFATEIFIDAKPALYDFANDTERLSEAEFMARFAPAEDGANDV